MADYCVLVHSTQRRRDLRITQSWLLASAPGEKPPKQQQGYRDQRRYLYKLVCGSDYNHNENDENGGVYRSL
jgi:hypothetical protein